MIAYDQECVIIDWERMKIFAALDKPLPKQGKQTYAPVKKPDKDWSGTPIRKTREYRALRYVNPLRQLEPWEQDFFCTLENMTSAECSDVIRGMSFSGENSKTGVYNDIRQPGLLSQTEYDRRIALDAAKFDGE